MGSDVHLSFYYFNLSYIVNLLRSLILLLIHSPLESEGQHVAPSYNLQTGRTPACLSQCPLLLISLNATSPFGTLRLRIRRRQSSLADLCTSPCVSACLSAQNYVNIYLCNLSLLLYSSIYRIALKRFPRTDGNVCVCAQRHLISSSSHLLFLWAVSTVPL